MNWAIGIGTQDGKLAAGIAAASGEVRLKRLDALIEEGIPAPSVRQKKVGLITNLKTWQLVAPDEYIAAHGLDTQQALMSRHQIFEFKVRDTIVQVPALVLIRALFYPAKQLLPTMFGPQALDAIGFLDDDVLHIEKSRTHVNYHWANEIVVSQLRWLYAFPSANRSAHSVHEHALRGIIGLTLPDAVITLAASGKKLGSTYFATEVRISKIVAQEASFSHVTSLPATIIEASNSLSIPADETIPLRDGSSDLSDDEWALVAPILLSKSNHRFRLSQRDLFDAILTKLSTGTPWRKLSLRSGTYVHASQAYRVWKSEYGTFGPALEMLKRLRSRN